jgi:exopolysaccharide biosynthesis polyprenyl glycosylphosphotransferase
MLRSHSRTFDRLVRTLDTVVVTVATVAAAIHCAEGDFLWRDVVLDGVIAGALWLVVSERTGMYRSRRTGRFSSEARQLLETTLIALGLAVLTASALHGDLTFPPLIAAAIALPTLVVERLLARVLLRQIRKRGMNTRRLVVVGSGAGARAILDRIERNDGYGIRVRGWVGANHPDRPFPVEGVEYLGKLDTLRDVLARECPDYVLLCPRETTRYGEVQEVFRICDEAGVQCQYAPSHLSPKNLKPAITWIDDIPVYSFHAQRVGSWQLAAKRVMDFAMAGIAVVALLPVFLAIAIAIKLGDGGPILFKQQRVGRRGRTFPCFKFRTMCVDAEAKLAALAGMNEVDGPVFKVKSDPRITPIGRFLRKYSLDELPQLFNVLRGEMSIVGPRPPLPSEVEKYDWWQRRRISVRPGITCIWQVWGRNKVSFKRWMEMDMEYIDNWNLWRDCKIILRTAFAVFRGTGQ